MSPTNHIDPKVDCILTQLLQEHKFTNAYRASDRVSQYLIRNVIYQGDLDHREVFFRTILFKLFNRIDTWELLKSHFGTVQYSDYSFKHYDSVLTEAMETHGSRIIAGHFQAEKDIDAYLGLEYDVIGIEEATTLSSRKHSDIMTCCRTSKPNWRPRIYSTSNPGGIGHAWYKAKLVAPFQNGTESDTRFVPARVTDNQFNNPDYTQGVGATNRLATRSVAERELGPGGRSILHQLSAGHACVGRLRPHPGARMVRSDGLRVRALHGQAG